jgi:putative MATE family efflux protein
MTMDSDTILGDPRRALASMAVPMVVSYLVSQINSFADASWCSGLGIEASSAVTTISPLHWMMMSAGMGLSIAAMSTIAFCIGAGDRSKAGRLASQLISLTLVSSLAVSVVAALLLDPVIDFMGAGDVREMSKAYMVPFLVMSWAPLTSAVLAGMIRAEGAARRSMVLLISSVALNMVLDPLLIYSFGMGVAGAGWATVVSSLLPLVLGLSWYMRGSTFARLSLEGLRPRKDDMRELLDVAVPRAAESMISNGSDMIQRVFVIFVAGTAGVAVYSLTWRYVALAMIPAAALGSALIPVCSAAFGQRDPGKAKQGIGYAVRSAMIICSCLSVFIFIFADQLVLPFSYSESMEGLRPLLAWSLRAYCVIIPFYALIGLGSAILQTLRMSRKATSAVLAINAFKLSLLGVACLHSFEAIFYALIISNVAGGMLMIAWAHREVERYEGRSLGGTAVSGDPH